MSSSSRMIVSATGRWQPLDSLFMGLAGLLLGVALLKYGNPVSLGNTPQWLNAPGLEASSANATFFERIINPWPLSWAYWTIAALVLVGLARFLKRALRQSDERKDQGAGHLRVILCLLPLLWLLWQGIASLRSIDPTLTSPTLSHFLTCALIFYAALFGMAWVPRPGLFLGLTSVAFGGVIAIGWYQHWVGLEETRRYFYELPNWRDFPPTFLNKLSSNRIYGSLFYPNALAGIILLLLPLVLAWLWQWTRHWEFKARLFLVSLAAGASVACLYWSQSKAGWLIFLFMGGLVFLHLPISRPLKVGVVVAVLSIGLVGFFLRYMGYFSRGAPSLVARFDYWRVGLQVGWNHPVIGTGPGTFMVNYSRLKPPQAEMARLAHNDYLQQLSDSGFPGLGTFGVFIWGSLVLLYRQRLAQTSLPAKAAWLGLVGYAIQSFVEFGLYIPASSWTAFFLFGWLLSPPRSDRLRAHESALS